MDDHAGLILIMSITTIFYCLVFLAFRAVERREDKALETFKKAESAKVRAMHRSNWERMNTASDISYDAMIEDAKDSCIERH